jgi:hypothetical protein
MSGKMVVDPQRLAAIQRVLGLSMRDFALVLGLSRQDLFACLDASREFMLPDAIWTRLAAVERIAMQWRERSTAPMGSVMTEALGCGRTAHSLMVAEAIDEAAIVGALDELATKLQGKAKSRSQKLADAGFTRRPSARALPTDE